MTTGNEIVIAKKTKRGKGSTKFKGFHLLETTAEGLAKLAEATAHTESELADMAIQELLQRAVVK